jgi:MEDS: MEthanogen/methylotroph, DcmR Sensory domain
LADPVAEYLAAGFEHGGPAVVVATPEHWDQFAQRLALRGWDARRLADQGLLTFADAETTLRACMVGDALSADAFDRAVGGLLDEAESRFPSRSIRAFGEMVDLLCRWGKVEAAAKLEHFWNELALTRNFSLLCGYGLDIFDRESQLTPLRDVCRAHSHVQPSPEPTRLAKAVDLALEEVLGATEAGRVYMMLGDQIREERVPPPQLALMWVSENMPLRADHVLSRARANYHGNPIKFAAV